MTAHSVHPIDTLLVQQLESLLRGETALRERYFGVNASSNSVEMRMAFSKDLADLQEKTDRLYRFVNEMDICGYGERDGRSYAAA